MGSGEVCDMDVIPNAGPIRGVIVVSENDREPIIFQSCKNHGQQVVRTHIGQRELAGPYNVEVSETRVD
jgi:hypothetical protein